MPTAALPIVPGTVRTASLLSDNRTGDQPETPFAALLDTGTGPQIQTTPVRTDKPQRRDTTTTAAAPASTKPAPAKPAKDASKETQPVSAEAPTDATPKAKDTADTGDKPVDAEADSETSAEADGTVIDPSAVLDGAVVAADAVVVPTTAVTPTPVAAVVQPVTTGIVSDGESAPTTEADVVVATVAGVTPEAGIDNSEAIAAPAAAEGGEDQMAALANKVEVKSEAKSDTVESEAPVDAKPVATKPTEQPKLADAESDNGDDNATLDTASADTDAEPVKSELHASPENKPAAKPSTEATLESSANNNANAPTGPRADAPASHTLRPDIVTPLHNGPLPGAHTVAQHAAQMQMQAPVAAAVPLTGLAVEIASQAKDGKNRFEIRLDPPELGRIDVRLDVDGQGNVTSRLLVERQDTLDLLRRDSTALERALNDAGLKTSNDGLQFSLRDQGANADQQRNEMSGRSARVVVPTESGGIADPSLYRAPRLGALDIRV